MEVRDAVHWEHARHLDTDGYRDHFLIQDFFKPDDLKLVYSLYDRMIIGGISPQKSISLSIDRRIIGSDYLLDRREMGAINIGGLGTITIDGKKYELENGDGLYIGMGSKDIEFSSDSSKTPAKFYYNSAPAHMTYPTTKISLKDAEASKLGSIESSNTRTIYKYIHPNGVKSCQLVMGVTHLEPNNVWNTMPGHTHRRRIEVYFYFNIPENGIVFQIMGKPSETRHLVMRNEEAALHPSWSMHSGVGASNYSFIWSMAGENQTFSDMDDIDMSELK